jgi:ABC-type branched-subunit amino acid transport system ATPase component
MSPSDQISPPTSLLVLTEVLKQFGGIVAVNEVSLAVPQGSVMGLVGPNGAGKTTLLNLISGFDNSFRGSIAFDGTEVARWPGHRLARAGVVRTFQHAHVFSSMTVLASLRAAAHVNEGAHAAFGLGGLRRRHTARAESTQLAESVLEQLHLQPWVHRSCAALPYGIKKRLGIGLALMRRPRLLLLDEPAAGLNTSETHELVEQIQELNRTGLTMILVEHNMPLIMAVSHKVVVLDHGVKVAEGSPQDIAKDPAVIGAYLGRR